MKTTINNYVYHLLCVGHVSSHYHMMKLHVIKSK